MALLPGQLLADKYRIWRLVGQGGMGEVYEGENERIRRRVAIKTLISTGATRPDALQRFEREAQAAGRIGSEHICEVLDLGDLADGGRYMVMEYLVGLTLKDRIVEKGRITPRESVGLLCQLLEGLAAAHRAGIIHRDLKPANIFLSPAKGSTDFVKILDFGVSKFSVLGDDFSMTSTGTVVGTPFYMSPEQAKGSRDVDARSDLYSTGVILYEATTGHVPFHAQTFNELIFKIALEAPPPPEQSVPDLDPDFGDLIRKAMARDPAQRFQSAEEFSHALAAWAEAYDRANIGTANARPKIGGTQLIPMVQIPAAPPPPAPGPPRASMAQGGSAPTMMLAQQPDPPGGYPTAPRPNSALGAPQPGHAAGQRSEAYPSAGYAQAGYAPAPGYAPVQAQAYASAAYPAAMSASQAEPKKSSNAGIVIALSLALVAGGLGAVFMITSRGTPAGETTTTTATATTATATTSETTAPPSASVTSQPSAPPVESAPPITLTTADTTTTAKTPWPKASVKPRPTSTPTSTPTSAPTGRGARPITGEL